MKTTIYSFTLIELLITIAIVGFLSGIGIVSYGKFNQETKLRQETDKIVDALNLARKKALAPDQKICDADKEIAYNLYSDSASYSVRECCMTSATKTIVGATCASLYSYSFPSNVSKIDGPTDINFYLVNNGSSGTPDANPFILKNSVLNKCFEVSVSTSGAINVSDISSC